MGMKRSFVPCALVCAFVGLGGSGRADPAPTTAQECHDRGMALRHGKGDHRLEDALVWLDKAARLAPANASYLADYGGTCLQIADRRRSFGYAVKGRDAMEKSLAMDPSQLDCRDGLMKFYARAPWPLGDADKALAQAGAIGRYNHPPRDKSLPRTGTDFRKLRAPVRRADRLPRRPRDRSGQCRGQGGGRAPDRALKPAQRRRGHVLTLDRDVRVKSQDMTFSAAVRD